MQNPTPLKRIMLAEGRRQSWLAAQIDKDQSEVSRIVNRGLMPDAETQQAIAKALNRKVEEFWPAESPAHEAAA
jgi:transcriptional regulator with XRE-family HTH domain